MKLYLLDSTLLAAFLSGRPSAVELIEPWIENHQAATSILCYGEVIEYLKSKPNFEEHQAQLKLLLSEIYTYFLTFPILERYADIRRKLRTPRGPGLIGDVDTLIAATAIERNLTLVTVDSDFERNIPNLKLNLIPRKTFHIQK
jgi:predicted nucleic acid-binding protein